jgi:hypothetical protein
MATVQTDCPKSWEKDYMPDVTNAELRGCKILKFLETLSASDGIPKFLLSIEAQGEGSSDEAFVTSYHKSRLRSFQNITDYRRSMLYKSAEALVPQETKISTDEREGTDFHAASKQRPHYLVKYKIEQDPSLLDNILVANGVNSWGHVAEYGLTSLYSVEPIS